MYEKILVTLDGSALAEMALPFVEEIAGKMGSEIIMLSVAESTEASEYHKSQLDVERVINDTRRHAEKYLKPSEKREIRVTAATVVGNPAEEIVNFAEREDIGLIVMATHGISGIRRWAVGSVADKVLRVAEQPVALIRAKVVKRKSRGHDILNRLMVALDGSKKSEAVLPSVIELARRMALEVILVQVVPESGRVSADAEGYLVKMTDALHKKGINVRFEVRVDDAAADEIIRMADEIGADMVAMATHGRSGVGRWSLGSVADKVIQGGSTPVFLVSAR